MAPPSLRVLLVEYIYMYTYMKLMWVHASKYPELEIRKAKKYFKIFTLKIYNFVIYTPIFTTHTLQFFYNNKMSKMSKMSLLINNIYNPWTEFTNAYVNSIHIRLRKLNLYVPMWTQFT